MSQAVSIPLYHGLDTKSDPKLVPPGKQTAAQNVFFPSDKRVNKRYGQVKLATLIANTQTSLPAATSFGTFKNELLLFTGSQLYSYGAKSQSWVSKASLTELKISGSPVVQNSATRSSVSAALAQGVEVYVWEDSRGGLRYSIKDQTSGAYYVADQQLDAAGAKPQLVTSGNYLNVFYAVGNQILARQLPLASPAQGFGASIVIATDYLAGGPLSVTAFVSGANSGRILLAYQQLTATQMNVYALGGNLVFQFQSAVGIPAGLTGLGIAAEPTAGGYAAIAMAVTGVNRVYVTDSGLGAFSFVAQTSTGNGLATVAWTGPTTLVAAWDQPATGSLKSAVVVSRFSQSAGTPTLVSTSTVWGLRLASHAFSQGGQGYLVGVSPKTSLTGNLSEQTAYYVVGQDGSLLLRFFGTYADGPEAVLSQPVSYDSATWLVALPYRLQLRTTSSGAVYATTGVQAAKINFPSPSQLRAVEFNNTGVINCGNVYSYDGACVVESGFWEFPEGITAAAQANGGGQLGVGLYSYIATYEWQDAAGNIHRSAPSFVAQVSPAAGQQVSVTVPTTSLTRRTSANGGDISITLYRSLVNGSGPYYQLTTLTQSNSGAFSGTPSVTFVDTLADSAISGNPFLYAPPDGSGELENDPPPPFLVTVATKTRVFGISQEDQTQLWYSKPLAPGRPAEWNAGQVVRVESAGGNATALGAMDTLLVLFKQSRIYYLPGDGPNAGGVPANGFSSLQLISTASGCASPGSIVPTDMGLFYQSQRGIELLTRGLSVNYEIGFPVDAYKTLALTAAVVVPAQSHVRFISSSGTALVFDYALGRWSTYSGYDGVGAGYWQAQNAFVRCQSTAQVWQESTSTFTDGGVPYGFTLETGWLPTANLAQGFARARRLALLGDYKDSHVLYIDIAYDYKDYSYTIIWNPQTGLATTHYGDASPYGTDQVYGGSKASGSIYQLRVRLPQQKCEAVRFRFRDVQPVGESCTLSDLALELEVKNGLVRLPAGQTV